MADANDKGHEKATSSSGTANPVAADAAAHGKATKDSPKSKCQKNESKKLHHPIMQQFYSYFHWVVRMKTRQIARQGHVLRRTFVTQGLFPADKRRWGADGHS